MQKQKIFVTHRFLQEEANRIYDGLGNNNILFFLGLDYLILNLKDSVLEVDLVVLFYPISYLSKIAPIVTLLEKKYPGVKLIYLISGNESQEDLDNIKRQLSPAIEFILKQELSQKISYVVT